MKYPLMVINKMEGNNITGGFYKVLSLEDTYNDFLIIKECLSDALADFEITHCSNEKEFIAALHENKYDVILADFQLYGFDAFGAIQVVKTICPNVPLICVSGTIGEETAIDLLKQGAVDYVLKDRLTRLPMAIQRALHEAKEKVSKLEAEEALKKKIDELQRFYDLTISRELTMIELKKEVNALLKELGREDKYRIVE